MTIKDKFVQLKSKNEKALITYVAGGDPDYDSSKKLIKTLMDNGADIIEIGIPFSDPMADGPTIQRASERALKNGFSLKKAIKMVTELRAEGYENPFVFMSYYNPIYKYGLEKFVIDAENAGVNGLIIPDLPPEEGAEIKSYTNRSAIDTIFLIAPTMTEQRLDIVSENVNGFIYLVSMAGVTGTKFQEKSNLGELYSTIKRKTDLPICVGFGISSKEKVKEISKFADGAIVGSAIIKLIEKNLEDKDVMIKEVGAFVKELKEGTVDE